VRGLGSSILLLFTRTGDLTIWLSGRVVMKKIEKMIGGHLIPYSCLLKVHALNLGF
jgi:hypothetical protein